MPFNEDIAECYKFFPSLYWYWLIQIKLVYFQILQKWSSDFFFKVEISYTVLNDNMKSLFPPTK